ncbi:hypothetical protein EV684_10699 [Rubrivivax gelatinosus]|uniref:Uncharacterized protein n=1 Tax=Rubrivivax gelatinosus TaxID=28068 RepID=A0A4R2MD34_RUBGE|nr:hypothetical protein [Rubrivivax gelatinosus]TCP02537.1 hypothetical protein EV684_10699 [Rubrivivax gelatinosus]
MLGGVTVLTAREFAAAPAPGGAVTVLVQSPAEALATAIASGRDEVDEVLAQWTAGARGLLQHLRGHRDRTVLLHADDLRADLGAAFRRAGVEPPASGLAPAPRTCDDPVLLTIVQAMLSQAPEAQRLHDLLLASCEPADGGGIAGTQAPVQAAAARWNTMRAAARDQARRLRDAGWRHERLQRMTAELDVALDVGQARQRELGAATSDLAAMRERAETSERLHAEQRRVSAELQRQAESDRERAGRDLAAARTECETLRQRVNALESRVRELEPLDTRIRFLDTDGEPCSASAMPDFRGEAGAVVRALGGAVDTVRIGQATGVAPHLGLNLLLSGVRLGAGTAADVSLRLVEHHARPGLALFDTADGHRPLARWEPDGEEGGRAFVLLVPEDGASSQRLAHMGSSDWGRLLLYVGAVEQALHQSAVSGRWPAVATALRGLLEATPRRWRYDAVCATPLQSGGLRVRFANVVWGPRHWPHVDIEWVDVLARPTEAWMSTPAGAREGRPVLGAVTPDADGGPALLRVPLQQTHPAAWQRLGPQDRHTLMAILDALPAVGDAGAPDPTRAVSAAQAARSMLAQALRHDRREQQRQVAAGLLRRRSGGNGR